MRPRAVSPPFGKATVKLAAVRRAQKGRPWLVAEDVVAYEGDGGPFVDLVDESTLPLGTAFFCPDEDVRVRLFASASTRDPLALLRTRLERSQQRRSVDLMGADGYRLCHAEADGVPRLFVDRFGSGLFVTTLCQATDALADAIIELLVDVTGATSVVHSHQGTPTAPPRLVRGDDARVRFHHGRLLLSVDLLGTPSLAGLTARLEPQRYVRRWAKGRVLDLFAKDGGFGLQLADAGAKSVLAVEADVDLARAISDDAQQNGLGQKIAVEHADPHERMRLLDEAGERFDVLVLHPDATAYEAKDLDAVKRRVFDAHRRALRLLDEGRILVTWPGATPLDEAGFEDVVAEAATRARKRLVVLARVSAGADHPTLLGVPEARAATTLVLRVLSTA